MRILLASSEVHPYSKTGGLADMVGALGKALAAAGHRVGIVTPLYAGVRDRFPAIQTLDWKLDLPLGSRRVAGAVCALELNERLTVYFIHQPEFYLRPELYQQDDADYPDNAERFLYLSKAVVQIARELPWEPEIVHLHDWQVGLVPLLIRHERSGAGWGSAPRTCMTIHNLAYQGVFPGSQFALTNLPWADFNPDAAEFYGHLNCLKAGIALADVITTVSPRYAREITTPEFGCSLDGLLRYRQKDLTGILNGVDYDEWDPSRDPHISNPYSADTLSGKVLNKLALQRELGLPENPAIPLFGSISRLVGQKGVDIQLAALEEMIGTPLQLAWLGSGTREFEQACLRLAQRQPSKVAVRLGYDPGLSHRIEAGCDYYLMPSRFEPCGLNQMYSLAYGTIPIVRVTGGLDDTVVDIAEDRDRPNGIKFMEYSGRALAKGIRKGLELYREPELLEFYRRNAMGSDFSWERTAEVYVGVYKKTCNGAG